MKFFELIQIFSAIILHESAHIFTAKLLGTNYVSPTPLPLGIKLTVDLKKRSAIKEVCVCLAGSTVGIITGISAYCLCDNLLDTFVFTSFTLSTLNLLPIKGLDGGETLNIITNRLFLPDTAQKISKFISEITVLLLCFISISVHMRGVYNLPMLFFTIWLIYSHL